MNEDFLNQLEFDTLSCSFDERNYSSRRELAFALLLSRRVKVVGRRKYKVGDRDIEVYLDDPSSFFSQMKFPKHQVFKFDESNNLFIKA